MGSSLHKKVTNTVTHQFNLDFIHGRMDMYNSIMQSHKSKPKKQMAETLSTMPRLTLKNLKNETY